MESQITNTTNNKYESTKKFVNNLDLLIGHDDKRLYGKASQEQINQVIQNFPLVDDDGNHFSIFTSIQKFQKFAPGVYLMFKLLKFTIFVFSLAAFLAMVQFFILMKSPFYKGHQEIVRINMLRLTIASLQHEDFNFYVGFDVFITLVILACLIWWSQKLRYYADICNQNIKLPSYLTVQLKNVDSTFSQESLANYLLNSYKIIPHQIYTGRNYGKFLKHYENLTETAIGLRIQKQLFQNEQEEQLKKQKSKSLLKKFLKLRDQFCSIKAGKFNEKKYKPKQVFIVLQNYNDRQKLIRDTKNLISCCNITKQTSEKQFQFKACQVEPEAIAWENIGLSKLNFNLRGLAVTLILCIFTFFGILVIFMLQILQTAAIGDAYHFHEENMANNDLQASGSQESCTQFREGQKCHQKANYFKLSMLIMLTPFTVFVCKKLIMALLSHFVHFRKYPTQISKIKSQTITLAIFYFIVIAALHLFLYLKIDSNGLSIYEMLHPIIIKMFNITNYKPASIHLYSDYTLDWYKQATFFIVIICSTSFNIANTVKFLINLVSYKLQVRRAKKQRTLYEVNKYLHGIDLHMEHVYASQIAIIYFALLYGCPIPITLCFALSNLVFLFYLTKWTFIKYGSKPLRMGHSINRTVSNMLLIGVIIHCLMTPLFLGAEGIGKNTSHYSYKPQSQNEKEIEYEKLSFNERYTKFGPFYLPIAVLCLLYILLRKPFTTHFMPYIRQKCIKKQNKNDITQRQKQREHFGLYPSYSMHNVPKYSEILKNVYLLNRIEAKRATCPLPKTMRMLSNENENEQSRLFAFDEILQINREYLDRSKYPEIYEKVEEIARISQSSFVKDDSIIDDKQTDDRIVVNYGLADQVNQNEIVEEQKQMAN